MFAFKNTFHKLKKYQKLSRRVSNQQAVSNTAHKHQYKILLPWKTLDEFVNHIRNNIIYNKDGLIAINKPYGVGVRKGQSDIEAHRCTRRTSMQSSVPESSFSMADALPKLCAKLGVHELTVIKSAEKYTTGVTLLSESSTIKENVYKSLSRSVGQPHMTYWAVTRGYPIPESGEEKMAIVIKENEKIGGEKLIELTDKFSKNDIKMARVKPVKVNYKCLSVNRELAVALVELQTSSIKNHFLRLYTTRKAACILGDTMYAARVKQILGKTVVLDTKNADKNLQGLSESVCDCLQIPLGSAGHATVPTMLHFHKLLLPKYGADNENLLITAPLPDHFEWTCQRLDLMPKILA